MTQGRRAAAAPAAEGAEAPEAAEAARAAPGARRLWVGLALVFAAVEITLMLADARWLGSPLWRPLAYQYGGFWAGLLHGWTPNYAAQPAAMFVTYCALHAGWQHLLGNLLALGWLGLQLERVMGAGRLAALFALSVLGGGLGFGLLASSPRPMVGASGAIMGLVAVWIAAEIRALARHGSGRRALWAHAVLRVALVALLNVLAWGLEAGGLAWETHLGGFLAAGLAMALVPALRPGRPAP
jgi:membrane associated rhomboid family serine protease